MPALITILTATYNRAHLLPDLFDSLCRQTSKDFEWLVIDDGSTDGTTDLVRKWQALDNGFPITLVSIDNGGKNRAINKGIERIKTPYTMIVDSDDLLTDDAVGFLSRKSAEVLDEAALAGVAGMRSTSPHSDGEVSSDDVYILATNLERSSFNLQMDANEVYKTSLLKTHPFVVWPGEKFVPEEVVWNQLALEGYKLRWYKKITYISRYQEGGMTKGSWKLLKDNPMGYAMMYNQRILLSKTIRLKIKNSLQFASCCILGKEPSYLLKCNCLPLIPLIIIPGIFLSLRRKWQFICYIDDDT